MFQLPMKHAQRYSLRHEALGTHLELVHNGNDFLFQSFIRNFPSSKVNFVAN